MLRTAKDVVCGLAFAFEQEVRLADDVGLLVEAAHSLLGFLLCR